MTLGAHCGKIGVPKMGGGRAMQDSFGARVAQLRPDLAGQGLQVLNAGWDCVAVVVGGHTLFKFPRHADAAARLEVEAGILDALARHVSLPIPRLHLFTGPSLCSAHVMIPGQHLLSTHYAALTLGQRDQLAADLAGFLADLHAMPVSVMQAAGAGPVQSWMGEDEIAARALPLLPPDLADVARGLLAAFAALSPDPLGLVYGFFDLHGWNMAFDHATGRLNGVYDFGDSGIGPLHREFVYPGFVSHDLTQRMIAAYQAGTGRRLDRARITCLTGVHRLWELAGAKGEEDRAMKLANVAAFAQEWPG